MGEILANDKNANIIGNAMIKQNAGLISKRGFQGVLNIYGKQLAASISKSTADIMLKNIGREVTIMVVSGIVNAGSSWLFSYWEG